MLGVCGWCHHDFKELSQTVTLNMKRMLADICFGAVLFGLLQMLSFLDVMAVRWGIYLLWIVPFFAGFVRGILERQFLKRIPDWIGVAECGLLVFAAEIILCLLGSKGKAPDNFWTIFGAFFIIFIVPSVGLSIGGFVVGLQFGKSRTPSNHF